MLKNTKRITNSLCRHETLVFYPKTEQEALYIQKNLLDLGCTWMATADEKHNIMNVAKSVEQGLVCYGGDLYCGIMDGHRDRAFLCTSDQFEESIELIESFHKASIMTREERIDLLAKLYQTYPEEFAMAACPVKLRNDAPVPLPLSFKKHPKQ